MISQQKRSTENLYGKKDIQLIQMSLQKYTIEKDKEFPVVAYRRFMLMILQKEKRI